MSLRSRLIVATLALTFAGFALHATAQTPPAAKPSTPAASPKPAAKPAAKPAPKSAAKPAARKPSGPAFVPQTTINWRGDIVSARGFTNDLVAEFRKEKKGLLNVQTFSTISGIDAVIDGSADVAGVARSMHESREVEKSLVFQPVALDAIVPVVHPRNPVTSISLAHLRQIYLGRIKNWKEIGGNDVPINLYSVAAPLDGVEYSFRQLLYKRGDQKVGVPRLYLNTSKLEEGIALDPASLGLSTLSSSYANKGMKMLSVEGIQASTSSVANGSYPLFTTLYIVHRSAPVDQARIDDFVLFLDSPTAHAAMRRHQLVPYADAGDVYTRDGERLSFIDTRIAEVVPVEIAGLPRARPPVMSAPRATLEARLRVAPTAESTQVARENLREAEAQKAANKGDGAPTGSR